MLALARPSPSSLAEIMREAYVTAYLPGEPQSGHRVADREGRTGPVARQYSDLPMGARAFARELLVNIDPKILLC
jgi:hypothetical protein